MFAFTALRMCVRGAAAAELTRMFSRGASFSRLSVRSFFMRLLRMDFPMLTACVRCGDAAVSVSSRACVACRWALEEVGGGGVCECGRRPNWVSRQANAGSACTYRQARAGSIRELMQGWKGEETSVWKLLSTVTMCRRFMCVVYGLLASEISLRRICCLCAVSASSCPVV